MIDLTNAKEGDTFISKDDTVWEILTISDVEYRDGWTAKLKVKRLSKTDQHSSGVFTKRYKQNGETVYGPYEKFRVVRFIEKPITPAKPDISQIKAGDIVWFRNGSNAVVKAAHKVEYPHDNYTGTRSYRYGLSFMNQNRYDFQHQEWLKDLNLVPEFIWYQVGGTYRGTGTQNDLDIVSYETVLNNNEVDLRVAWVGDSVVVDGKMYEIQYINHINYHNYGYVYDVKMELLPDKRMGVHRKFKENGTPLMGQGQRSRYITKVVPKIKYSNPEQNVKEFDLVQMDYSTTEQRIVGYYTNEFDSHILDALSRKQLVDDILQLEQLIEFLRLPTITINQPNEETKMTETTKPKTGKEILEEGIASVDISAGNQLKSMIVQTTNEIRGRETWIATRTKQIAALKELQKDAVKAYDEGTFTHNSKSFNERLNVIQNERVS